MATMDSTSSHLPAWLTPYRGHRLSSSYSTVSEDGWILQPLQYAVEIYEESRLTDPWYATLECIESVRCNEIALFSLRSVFEPIINATLLVREWELSPIDPNCVWIEVIGENGQVLTSDLFRTAERLFYLSIDEAPARARFPDRFAPEPHLPECMPPEPPWHALLKPLILRTNTGGEMLQMDQSDMRATLSPRRPTAHELFEVYRLLVTVQESLYSGGEAEIASRMGDLASRVKRMLPSSSDTITEIGNLTTNLGAANASPATSAVIAVRLTERVSKELGSVLASDAMPTTPPFPDVPFDKPSREAVRNLMLYLWGRCSAEVPNYNKSAWQSVCGELNGIGAMDW